MLIFPQDIKCTHILTFFFRINSFLANRQKGRGSHLKKGAEGGTILYMKKAIAEGGGSDNSTFSLEERK